VTDFEKINIGDQMPSLTKEPISEIQLAKYAGASGDFNPLLPTGYPTET